MKAILTDLLAIIGVVLNGLPQGLLALTFGFATGSDGAGILLLVRWAIRLRRVSHQFPSRRRRSLTPERLEKTVRNAVR